VRGVFGIIIGGLFLLLLISIYQMRVVNTTVLIQAGHEGRTKGNIGSIRGDLKEVDWNILVSKEIERELKRENIDVTRVGADIPIANARIAIAIHFDGATRPCSTGASIGYDEEDLPSKKLAKRWREIYQPYFPFHWHKDNFTKNLSQYYGFNRVHTEKGFLVLELGEITCQEQTEWLEPRLEIIATKVADFIIEELER
jgi:hypothetical protein